MKKDLDTLKKIMKTQSNPAQKEHAEERVYTAISIFCKKSAIIKKSS